LGPKTFPVTFGSSVQFFSCVMPMVIFGLVS
jgi:hypothetical protein